MAYHQTLSQKIDIYEALASFQDKSTTNYWIIKRFSKNIIIFRHFSQPIPIHSQPIPTICKSASFQNCSYTFVPATIGKIIKLFIIIKFVKSMDTNLKDQDVLLVKDKNDNKLYAPNIDKNGDARNQEIKKGANPDFLKIDASGNALSNFFENFMRQMKDPTRFEFFRVPSDNVSEPSQKLQEAFKNPDKPENKEFIDMHRVNPDDYLNSQKTRQSQPYNAIDESHVPYDQFERIGITRETLEKTGNLDKLLNWQKTDLLPITIKVDDATVRTEARLALRQNSSETLTLAIHALRKEPELDRPYFNVKFTDEDKRNLRETGHLGRIAEAEYKQGEKTPVFISIDKQTNELVSVRAEKVKIPESIKDVQLNEQQKKDLSEGKAVWIEGMTSKKGNEFSAYFQFNADKKGFEFRFDNDKQNQKQSQQSQQSQEAPKTFRKKELTEDQRSSLTEGKTVYVSDLEDKKGKKYSGYITMNKETGKTDFMFSKDYKEAVAAGKVIPDDRHKTQVEVNSKGKTDEATKNVKEPLQPGQTKPTEKQAEKQENEDKAKKKKGVKM